MQIPEFVRFVCQPDCSACCRIGEGKVFITENEARHIAAFLNISEAQLLDSFTRIQDDRFCLTDGAHQRCIFLKGSLCSVYDVRPGQCRTYPFWPENMKNESRWRIIKQECPGIGKGKRFSSNDIKRIMNGGSLDSEK
jgi:Fe-S-cluster containining protein